MCNRSDSLSDRLAQLMIRSLALFVGIGGLVVGTTVSRAVVHVLGVVEQTAGLPILWTSGEQHVACRRRARYRHGIVLGRAKPKARETHAHFENRHAECKSKGGKGARWYIALADDRESSMDKKKRGGEGRRRGRG